MWADKCWHIKYWSAYIECIYNPIYPIYPGVHNYIKCIYNIKPTNVTTATLTKKRYIQAWGCVNIMSTSNVTTATITLSYILLFTLRRYINTNRQLLINTWIKKLCIWKANGAIKKKNQKKFIGNWIYTGVARKGSSLIYTGVAGKGSSLIYTGVAGRGSSLIYTGVAGKGSSLIYTGVAGKGSSRIYTGVARKGSSRIYAGVAGKGSSRIYIYGRSRKRVKS